MAVERVITLTGDEMEVAMMNSHKGKPRVYTQAEIDALDPATFGVGSLFRDDGVQYWNDGASFAIALDTATLNEANGFVNLTGFDPTGATDDSQLIRDQGAAAKAAKLKLKIPAWVSIGIGSTVDVDFALDGSSNYIGANTPEITTFISLISDGSPVFRLDGQSRYSLSTFQILGTSNNLDPATNSQNCIGLQIGDPDFTGNVTDHACTNGILENIDIYGCREGIRSLGWSNNWSGISVRQAVVGLYLDRFNGGNINFIRLYNCNQYFKIRNTNGINLGSISCEGMYETMPSTIDSGVVDASGGIEYSNGININHIRYENSAGTPTCAFLQVGFNSPVPVRNLVISSGVIDKSLDGVDSLQLDNVIGHNINAFFKGKVGFSKTTNTRQRLANTNIETGFVFRDDNINDVPALNVFPNPFFKGQAFPATSVITSCTVTEETSNFRTGSKALRITGQATRTSCRQIITIDDVDTIAALKTGAISVGAWVYIPNEAAMDSFLTTTPIRPQIVVVAYNGATSVHVLATAVRRQRVGGWSFLSVEKLTADSVFDSIQVRLFVNNGGQEITANLEYMIIDSLHICPGLVTDKIYKGCVEDSPINTCTFEGGKLNMTLSQAASLPVLADSTNNWNIGDRVNYKDPVAGGFTGQVYTSGGWKDFGAISV